MKTLRYIALILTAFVTALSCVSEDGFTPGETDVEGCYGVFFPEQEVSGEQVLDPSEKTQFEITVMRKLTEGEIEVPYEITTNTDGVFSGTPLVFADGSDEAVITVSFDEAQIGTLYSCEIVVSDPQYASKYSAEATYINFNVVRVKWTSLGNALYTEDFVTAFFDAGNLTYEVEVQENDNEKGVYRLVNPYGKAYPNNEPGDYDETTDRYMIIDATDPNAVILRQFRSGMDWGYGEFVMWSLADYYISSGEKTKEQVKGEGLCGALKDGIITFPANQLLVAMLNYNDAGLYNANANGAFRVALPGAVLTDFSLKMQAGLTEEGKVPVTFTAGPDVAKIKYKTYEGTLNASQKEEYIGAVADGTEKDVETLTTEEGTTSYMTELSFDKTGVYSLVAVTFDAEGKAQEGETIEFTYLADEDAGDHAVIVTAGLELTSRFEAAGHTRLNSMQFYIYGKELTTVYYDLVETALIEKEGLDKIVDKLFEGTPADEEELALINGNGSSDLFIKLNPLTSYTLVVYASNGYAYKVVTAELSTEGLPLELVGEGEYTFSVLYEEPGSMPFSLYLDPNVTEVKSYQLKDWGLPLFGGSVPFIFTVDEQTGKVIVPAQMTGAVHSDYGPIMVGDAKELYTQEHPEYKDFIDSYYDAETRTYNFCVAYIVQAGGLGWAVETFVLDKEGETSSFPLAGLTKTTVATAGVRYDVVRQTLGGNKAGLQLCREPKAAEMTVNSVSAVKFEKQVLDKSFVKADASALR